MKIIIIGGGIGGLTTAIALQQRGFDAHGYEAAPEIRPTEHRPTEYKPTEYWAGRQTDVKDAKTGSSGTDRHAESSSTGAQC